MVSLGKKLKFQKKCEKLLYKHIKVHLGKKKDSKKHLIFEKWDQFENWQKWR